MKAIPFLLVLSVVCAQNIVDQIASVHANIEAVRDMHNQNIASAHATIMGLDLHAHHIDILGQVSGFQVESAADFESQDQLATCVSAAQNFGAVVNAGCNAVFVIFNNTFTDVTAGHNLMATHCNGATACHATLSQAIAAVGQACGPVMSMLPGANLGNFIENLKAAILLTEMPCIRSDSDPTKFCFEDVINLRQINTDPGVGAVPSDAVLQQYCTPCIFKLFSAAATFAPDYARVQFSLMAANCWQFPIGGPYCVRKFNDVVQESAASRNAENGTSVAHLDLVCHPCVRIFLRRVAILYSDPVFQGRLLNAAKGLFFYVHTIDAICLARGVGDYCVRALMPDLIAGKYQDILPIPGRPCYDSLIAAGNTCPACGDEIKNLTTAHGCCAVALYRLAGLDRSLQDSGTANADNRDDPTFPANRMVTNFNAKCPEQATQIVLYCTTVAINFRITLRNIAVAYYLSAAAIRDAFHTLVIADIAEFLGMVAKDISIPNPGVSVQSTDPSWYSSFVPSSFSTQDTSLTLSISVQPDNDANGVAVNSYVSTSLAAGNVPFPNTASDVRFLADPTVQVTAADSSASTMAASLLMLVILALFQL